MRVNHLYFSVLTVSLFFLGNICFAQTFSITTSIVGKGAITPSGHITVPAGGNQIFSITPRAGYRLSTLFVDGQIVAPTSTVRFVNVRENRSLTASFLRRTTRPNTIGTGTLFSQSAGQLTSFITQIFSISNLMPKPSVSANTFGGRITGIIQCTCTPGITQISVSPPKGGDFLLIPGSQVYDYGNISPGTWVLGDYSPSGVCVIRISDECVPKPTTGTIVKIGTS